LWSDNTEIFQLSCRRKDVLNTRLNAKPKVLLVNPALTRGHPPSLGVACLAAHVGRAGFEVGIDTFQPARSQDLAHFRQEETAFMARIQRRVSEDGFNVVGITTSSSTCCRTQKVATAAKEAGAFVVGGGPHVTLLEGREDLRGHFLREDAGMDVLVRGPGEEVLVQLLEHLRDGLPLADVPSLSFIEDGEYRLTEPGKPNPAGLWEAKPLWALFGEGLKNTLYLPILASRGCIYRCSFCTEKLYIPEYVAREPEDIVEELEEVCSRKRRICFHDSSFSSYPHLPELFEAMLCSRKIQDGIGFIFYARADEILRKKELIPLMRRAGGRMALLGIESGDDAMLREMHKGITTEQVREAVELLRHNNIVTKGFFMLGFPGETPDSVAASITFARSLGLFALDWHFFSPSGQIGGDVGEFLDKVDLDLPLQLVLDSLGENIHNLNPWLLSMIFTARRVPVWMRSQLAELNAVHPPSGLPMGQLLAPLVQGVV